MAKKKYLKLKTPEDVRKSINRISNMMLNNELDAKTGNALIYACNAVLNSIRTDEIDKQFRELQKELKDRGLL